MDKQPTFRAHAFPTPPNHADDPNAVMLGYGRMVVPMTIAEARELSMALARAADQAELKLPD
jgi:hypothetical protein